MAKVTKVMIKEFHELRSKGLTVKKIADEFNLADTTVYFHLFPKIKEHRRTVWRERSRRIRSTPEGRKLDASRVEKYRKKTYENEKEHRLRANLAEAEAICNRFGWHPDCAKMIATFPPSSKKCFRKLLKENLRYGTRAKFPRFLREMERRGIVKVTVQNRSRFVSLVNYKEDNNVTSSSS